MELTGQFKVHLAQWHLRLVRIVPLKLVINNNNNIEYRLHSGTYPVIRFREFHSRTVVRSAQSNTLTSMLAPSSVKFLNGTLRPFMYSKNFISSRKYDTCRIETLEQKRMQTGSEDARYTFQESRLNEWKVKILAKILNPKIEPPNSDSGMNLREICAGIWVRIRKDGEQIPRTIKSEAVDVLRV